MILSEGVVIRIIISSCIHPVVLGTRYWIKYNYIITYVIGRVMCNKYEYSYEYYLFTLIYIDRYHEYR